MEKRGDFYLILKRARHQAKMISKIDNKEKIQYNERRKNARQFYSKINQSSMKQISITTGDIEIAKEYYIQMTV